MIPLKYIRKALYAIKPFNGLGPDAIKLLISNLLFDMAAPLINIFSNSFFWYKTGDLKLIILFYLFYYLAIPVSYYLNAFLLKKIKIKIVGFFGLILQGFALLLYVTNMEPTVLNIFIYGSILGIFGGLYWANRSFMEFQTTKDENRDFYYGLYLSAATIISIIFYPLYGNFLGHSDVWGFDKNTLYVITSFFGFFVILFSGYFLLSGKFRNPIVRNIFLSSPSNSWKKMRQIYLLTGIREANSFLLPTLIILYMLKTEDFLGEANALASFVVAIVIFFIGSKITKHQRKKVITIGILILILNSFLILFTVSEYYAFLFNTIESTGNILIYLSLIPVFFKQLGIQTENSDSEYKFLFDSELFLNIGRILGTVFILIIFTLFGDFWGTELTPLIFVLPHLLFLRITYLIKD